MNNNQNIIYIFYQHVLTHMSPRNTLINPLTERQAKSTIITPPHLITLTKGLIIHITLTSLDTRTISHRTHARHTVGILPL